ncbi:STAS domain-containing protein [Magnetospirillum sulfuroxidans]|uniref:STAS domain-containing protein n=1 Tax=Magnetospirillum sulfuroxidans TaxID=611300 RepID=A0ABS5I9P1_9PROT|nr:STAS domain-containing protein [Magnetospirillum sulfuroxidans]MBR9970413.1 STAS domain-containing protein [Magnetospirillum sulfuroxidans]
MDFQINQEGGGVVAVLSGRLTFKENTAFRTLLGRLGQAKGGLVLDLRQLEFIDSAGLGMLLVMRDGHDGAIGLRTGDGLVARLLDLARFSDFFRME